MRICIDLQLMRGGIALWTNGMGKKEYEERGELIVREEENKGERRVKYDETYMTLWGDKGLIVDMGKGKGKREDRYTEDR